MEIIGWVATILVIVGAVLVNRKKRFGFMLWVWANMATAAYHGYFMQWSMLARDAIFLILATGGYYKWLYEENIDR